MLAGARQTWKSQAFSKKGRPCLCSVCCKLRTLKVTTALESPRWQKNASGLRMHSERRENADGPQPRTMQFPNQRQVGQQHASSRRNSLQSTKTDLLKKGKASDRERHQITNHRQNIHTATKQSDQHTCKQNVSSNCNRAHKLYEGKITHNVHSHIYN